MDGFYDEQAWSNPYLLLYLIQWKLCETRPSGGSCSERLICAEGFASCTARFCFAQGTTPDMARDMLADVNYFGTMMVRAGDADGMVSGACHTTASTIRPGLQASD